MRKTLLAALLLSSPAWAVGTSTVDVSQELAAAKAMIAADKFARAIPILKGVVDAEPDNADAFNLLGFTHRKLDRFEAAGEYYSIALALDPDHLGALEYQGQLFVELGDKPAAQANLEAIFAICGEDCEAYQSLSEALEGVSGY